jgi:predicted amidophosphoribosyltransferase
VLLTRHTLPQSELQRSAQLEDLKGAFAVEPLRTAELKGRRVELVDDLMSSGAFFVEGAERSASGRRDTSARYMSAPWC